MVRVVLDTNVLVAGLRSRRGASFAILSSLPSPKYTTVISVPLYLEYQDVVFRPNVLPAMVNRERVAGFLRYVASVSLHQEIYFLWRPWLADPRDDMVLEAAVAGHCTYIVTMNLKDFEGVERFNIRVVQPGEFLSLTRRQI